MEESKGSPIEIIRSSLRAESKHGRKDRRSDIVNSSRSALGDVSASIAGYNNVEDIVKVASKLKHKNQVSLVELKKLKHAFIQSHENIAAFLNVPGALHGLVRELSGQNAEFQFAALNCCCNLALGEEKLCHQLTKAAASYLTPNLDSLNNVYLDTCLWTLGNMAGGGKKPWSVLRSQGVINKLLHFLSSTSTDVTESAIYATTLYVKSGFDDLQPSEFRMLADHSYSLLGKEQPAYWLIYLLSCSSDANEVFLMNSVASCVCDLLVNIVNSDLKNNFVQVTALLRTLANLCGEDSKQAITEIMLLLDVQSVDFLTAINGLLASPFPHLQKETLWFLGNLLKCCPEAGDFVMSLEDTLKGALKKVGQV